MAINLFLNRVNKEEFIEIIKTVIYLVYKKTSLTPDIVQFIIHLTKFYNFNDKELENLFIIDTRDDLNIKDTISKLTKQSSKILLFLMTLFSEIFDDIDLDDLYKKEKILKQLPIDKQLQKNILKQTQKYIENTIVMHYFIYDKKTPFYMEFTNALKVTNNSKEKHKQFFLIDFEKLEQLQELEKRAFLETLYSLMLDDNKISDIEKEAIELWSLYLKIDFKDIEKRTYNNAKECLIEKIWLKNFLLFTYLITQNNHKKSLENAQKILFISDSEAKELQKNIQNYLKVLKELHSLIFSAYFTYNDETKAEKINRSLKLAEVALFAMPQTHIFKSIKAINIARKTVGAKLISNDRSEVGIEILQSVENNKLVVVIDGFLSEGGKKQFKDWMKSLQVNYPDSNIVGFKWKSQNLKTIMNGGVATWYKAIQETLEASNLLSNYLMDKKEHNPDIKITLMGHSLGARVIFNTLYQLLDTNTKVDSIFLLGGAVNNSAVNWSDVAHSVSNNIINFYSKNDSVLKNLYQPSMLDIPIGLSEIEIIKTKELKELLIKNFDVTNKISGHTVYKENLKELLEISCTKI